VRKYLQFSFFFGLFGFLVLIRQLKLDNHETPAMGSNFNTLPTQTLTTPTPSKSVSQTTMPMRMYKDGTYKGSVEDAFYGYVQVAAVIQDGKLADVLFLQYPNDNRTSIYVNTQALPLLKQEAIAAQSANVDIISGASATSPAFKASLQNALSKARIK
jgi:uncharacterized protein with FMN-binding domain